MVLGDGDVEHVGPAGRLAAVAAEVEQDHPDHGEEDAERVRRHRPRARGWVRGLPLTVRRLRRPHPVLSVVANITEENVKRLILTLDVVCVVQRSAGFVKVLLVRISEEDADVFAVGHEGETEDDAGGEEEDEGAAPPQLRPAPVAERPEQRHQEEAQQRTQAPDQRHEHHWDPDLKFQGKLH